MKSPLVATFQDFRRILGVCPCCGELFRLTDLVLAYRAKAIVTWLDRLESAEDRQQRVEDKFAEDAGILSRESCLLKHDGEARLARHRPSVSAAQLPRLSRASSIGRMYTHTCPSWGEDS